MWYFSSAEDLGLTLAFDVSKGLESSLEFTMHYVPERLELKFSV